MAKPASQIEVKAFHHTLLWPVLMRGPDDDAEAPTTRASPDVIDRFVAALQHAGWQEQVSPDGKVHPDYIYEEVVYFHPFVRDFLFGNGVDAEDSRPLRRMKRGDLQAMAVRVSQAFEIELKVERAELLLIQPQVALLLIELSNRAIDAVSAYRQEPKLTEVRTPLTLAQVLTLQSYLRHIYPPYFRKDNTHGDCPVSVTWTGHPNSEQQTCSSEPKSFREFVSRGAEPPVYSYWMDLFNKPDDEPKILPLASQADRRTDGLYLQQLLDDRMPAMSFIAVADPSEIQLDDEDRLPVFDSPDLEYQPEFRDALRSRFRYDRFRHWGTTYYCNGTSFAVICNDQDFSNLLLTHFRRHYTHLAVIAQYQHAALLYFADELAEIAKQMGRVGTKANGDETPHWRHLLKKVQNRFLRFRTWSYFTEVSNQIQGKDLFRLWYDRLDTKSLFERVETTCSDVYEAVENDELMEITRSQHRLETLAVRVLPILITVDVLAMFFSWVALFPPELHHTPRLAGQPIWGPWLWIVFGLIPLALAMALYIGIVLGFGNSIRRLAKGGRGAR